MSKKQEPENIPAVAGGKTTNINEVKTTLDSKDISNEKKFNLLEQVLSDPYLDKHEILDLGIRYLNNLKNPEVKEYISVSKEIMKKLHNAFQGDELYKPWVRYFDVSCKVEAESIKEEERSIFTSGISTLVQELLFENGNDQIDWRIIKKMLEVSDILFEKDTIDISQQEDLFKSIKVGIEKAIEFLLWKDPNIAVDSTKLTTNTLKILKDHFSNQSKFNQLKEAILSSRFDKDEFELTNTVIMGEDGGMYLLLNNLTGNKQIFKEVASDDYINDKLPKDPLSQKGEKQQITIGEGGLGTVRFALSLFDAKSKPGDLICIKKTKSINYPEPSYEQIIDATLRDYFTNDVANIIYAPDVFDMALVTDRDVGHSHRKGYLMMEVLPQNTATKVFKDKKYQKWEYQKPYLLDVFQKILDLLGQNIAMTDIKPDNTLYDTDTRKATIIDLGGTVKIDKKQEIKEFNIRKYSFQHTPEFAAPELQQKEGIINIKKALSYACGKIIDDITKGSDEDKVKLKELTDKLICQAPNQRISIKNTIKEVSAIGDDSYKENIIFTHYISKIKERLKNNKSSISINEDIEKLISNQEVRELVSNKNIENTESLYIYLYTTKLNPYKYANLNTDILSEKIDGFWSGSKEVMLLLGVAGAGKSITLQLKFIEAIKNWKVGDPLPIYFNLASNIDLVKIIDSLNNELGTNLKLNDLKNAHLYIDSFDEGLGITTERETLIRDYIKKLENSKILISCRTDYLPGNNDYNWFMPESKQLEVCYITPINYSEEQKLEKYISNYVQYVTKCSDKTYNNEETHDKKYYLDKIAQLKIESIIDTGFMFEIVMQTIGSIDVSSTINKPISRQDIYDEYLKIKQGDRIAYLHERQKDKIDKLLSSLHIDHNENIQELKLNQRLKELGKYIATVLHLQNVFRIKDTNELFKAFEYEDSTLFKQQALYHILKLLPLKIETKTLGYKVRVEQEIEIGFAHVIFKNYYLFEAIKDEVERFRESKISASEILTSHSIVKDVELIKLIAEDIVYDKNLQKFLRQAIDGTKQDKSDEAVTFASNSITLLVAAQYSFSGEDLSNISIRGANIRNGIFQYVDFSNADLTGVNLTNANLVGAKFIGTDMTGIELSMYPDLGHHSSVNCVQYSPDGKYIASGSNDRIIRIWNAKDGSLFKTLEGHTNSINCISYYPDGKYLASGSEDKTIKIWNTENGNLFHNLTEHIGVVQCVRYSPNGKYLASTSDDKTAKIWNAENAILLQTLQEDVYGFWCLSYSPDGKNFASGSFDGLVKIWSAENPENTRLLKTLIGDEGFTHRLVRCISYSPDGKYLASIGSSDQTTRIWNTEDDSLLQTLRENRNPNYLSCLSYSPDGKYFASGSLDNTVKIWNTGNGSLVQTLVGHTSTVECLSYSPDGKYFASASSDKTVKIWSTENGSLLQTLIGHTSTVKCLSYSPDGKYLTLAFLDGTVEIWDAENANLLRTLPRHNCTTWSPNGKYLASYFEDNTVKIWNVKDGSLFQDIEGHTKNVTCISYSPDGKYLASGSEDKTVKIWNAKNGNLLQTLEYYEEYSSIVRSIGNCISYIWDKTVEKIWNDERAVLYRVPPERHGIIYSISYSPDGRYLASGSEDKIVKIWNAENGRLLQTLQMHIYTAWSPNSKYLALISYNTASVFRYNTIKIWDVEDSRYKSLNGHTQDIIYLRYSSDGKYLASCSLDHTVKIWNAENGILIQTLPEHNCTTWSPNGKYLALGFRDGIIKIWNVEDNSLFQDLEGHTKDVMCISYFPDGKYLASSSKDRTVKIWEKKSDPQSKEDIWCLTKEISATESPLVCEDATFKEAIISAKNQAVFEQKGAKVIDNIIDNTENKEVNSKEVVIPKKTVNKEPNALLKEKLELAAKQKTLKLVKVKSKFIKEPIKVDISTQNDYTSVNVLMGIKYDNPLLNNPMLLKKLASNLNININQAIDASNHCTNLFGSKDFNYICNSDQSLLQELLGNYCEY